MITSEILPNGCIRHYSDIGNFIRQIETDIIYEDAVDMQPCPYTYKETDTPIKPPTFEELLDIIVGSEAE